MGLLFFLLSALWLALRLSPGEVASFWAKIDRLRVFLGSRQAQQLASTTQDQDHKREQKSSAIPTSSTGAGGPQPPAVAETTPSSTATSIISTNIVWEQALAQSVVSMSVALCFVIAKSGITMLIHMMPAIRVAVANHQAANHIVV